MAFVRAKIIGGKKYFYYVQDYKIKGRTRQKVIKYLGKVVPKSEDIKKLKKEYSEKKIQQIIRADLKFTPKLITKEQLAKAESLRQAFFKNIKSMGPATKRQFIRRFRTAYTYHSCAIEGNTLSQVEVNLVVNEYRSVEGKSLYEIDEVKNHHNAIEFMVNEKRDISEEFIKKLHGKVTAGLGRYRGNPDIAPHELYDPNFVEGDYRIDQRYIRGAAFVPPSADKVVKEMKGLVDFYTKNKYILHPLELASVFHYRFERIHPFSDGNGRVGRLLMNFILDMADFPMIDISVKNRVKYIKALSQKNSKQLIPFLISELKNYLNELFR